MELERWLSIDRLAHSDFMEVVFDGVKSGHWSSKQAVDLSDAAFSTFGNGCCYFLASAIADQADMMIVGFWRQTGDDRLVHAVIFNPQDGYAFDILGHRPLSHVRDELGDAVGGVRMSVLPSIRSEMDDEELDCLLDIAAGLPWMPVHRRRPDALIWADLIHGYTDARNNEVA